MLSHSGTTTDEVWEYGDGLTSAERRDVLLWSLAAFALGMLSAWIGALAWIGVKFLTL